MDQSAVLQSDRPKDRSMFACAQHATHTPFAVQTKTHVLQGRVALGDRAVLIVPRDGDVLHKCTVSATVRRGAGEAWFPMEQLCERVELWIGGNRVDTHTATYFRVYDELERPPDARNAYHDMTNFHRDDPVGCVKTMHMPLLFWFCQDTSKALNLVGLEFDEVTIIVHLASTVPGLDPTYDPQFSITCEYAFLDAPERALLATTERRMLVDTMQIRDVSVTLGGAAKDIPADLSFIRNPCTSIAWVFRGDLHGAFTGSGKPLEGSEAYAPLASARLLLDGRERFAVRPGPWFRAVEPLLRHGRAGSSGVYSTAFGLNPGGASAKGTLNFGEFDAPILALVTKREVAGSTNQTLLQSPQTEALEGIGALRTLTIMARTWNWFVTHNGKGVMLFD